MPHPVQLPVVVLQYYSSRNCTKLAWKFEHTIELPTSGEEEPFYMNAGSMKLIGGGGGRAEFYNHKSEYIASIFSQDDCVQVFHYPTITKVKLFRTQLPPSPQISK
jgi:hypothetical protein